MSYAKIVVLICNGRCSITFTSNEDRVDFTRARAREEGWTFQTVQVQRNRPAMSIDLCPDCSRRALSPHGHAILTRAIALLRGEDVSEDRTETR